MQLVNVYKESNMGTLLNKLYLYTDCLTSDRSMPHYNNLCKTYKEDDTLASVNSYLEYCSPYLMKSALSNNDFFTRILHSDDEEAAFSLLLQNTRKECSTLTEKDAIARNLRILKQQGVLLTALCDIAKVWNISQATAHLSKLADCAMDIALDFLLRTEQGKGNLKFSSSNQDILSKSGFAVIAMGKLGANELNYSSDIDLILLYDADKVPYCGKDELPCYMVKLARNFIALIEDKTKDGYVFRVDVRIRPDPSSTPLIMTANAAESYYESFGKNWERAALIKARACSGDKTVGNKFITRITPFVFRRSLDFKAISDISNIKEQISAKIEQRKAPDFTDLFSYNIKLGKGGIREIEFFAQIRQLIWGGHNNELRQSQTLSALEMLCRYKYISKEECIGLSQAYIFLRNTEHRLQLANDEQTHCLGKTPAELEKTALFMGFSDTTEFLNTLSHTLKYVSDTFDNMFFAQKDNQGSVAALLQDETQATTYLRAAGFTNTDGIFKTIDGWSKGIYRCLRSSACSHSLPVVLPKVLSILGSAPNPDNAFNAFDILLSRLTYGIEIFPLFENKPDIMEIVLDILAQGNHIAAEMQKNPTLIVDLINPDFFMPLPNMEALTQEACNMAGFDNPEKAFNAITLWVNSKKFQASVHLYKGLIDGKAAGIFISDLAKAALKVFIPYIQTDFARTYGYIQNSTLSVLLLGKAGSGEANPLSDLDLIFIYDGKAGDVSCGGNKSLEISDYYARLVRKFMTCITMQGKYGKLWEVDVRLRPSGKSGPIAVHSDAFFRYQKNDAWTWEYMALCKADVVYGDTSLAAKIKQVLQACAKKNKNKLKSDIISMRDKLLKEKPAVSPWDVKNAKGGMTDIEFLAAYYQLAFADKHPDILQRNTIAVLNKAKDLRLLAEDTADFLISCYDYMLSLRAFVALDIKPDLMFGDDFPDRLAKDEAAISEVFYANCNV